MFSIMSINLTNLSTAGTIPAYPGDNMMVRVYVTLKSGVLDPQGLTIQKALATLGYSEAAGVRQGKYFEIEWQGDSGAEGRRRVEAIAAEVLSNPVIESYRIDWS